MHISEKYQLVIQKIDEINSLDPNMELVEGESIPKELAYSRRMSEWLDRIAPDSSEQLRLAVRCQHIKRWAIPRNSYPMDRVGYLKWRTDLKKMHADIAAGILNEVGYDADFINSVQSIIRKEGLRDNPDTQTLEDVACLVFLENYFHDFTKLHDEEKVISIVRKTWNKMSPKAHGFALELNLSDDALSIVKKALQD